VIRIGIDASIYQLKQAVQVVSMIPEQRQKLFLGSCRIDMAFGSIREAGVDDYCQISVGLRGAGLGGGNNSSKEALLIACGGEEALATSISAEEFFQIVKDGDAEGVERALTIGGIRFDDPMEVELSCELEDNDGEAMAEVESRCCRVCAITSKPLSCCGSCPLVLYCGKVCQKSDWSSHKVSCPGFQGRGSSPHPVCCYRGFFTAS